MSKVVFENKPRYVVGLCGVFDSWVRDLNIEAFQVIKEMHSSHTAVRAFGAKFGRNLSPTTLDYMMQMNDSGIQWCEFTQDQLAQRRKLEQKIKGA